MTKKLLIAGHGLNKNNGVFDGGASGLIGIGEHKYMTEKIFPAMKKFIPDARLKDFVFHTDYNVYSHRNLVSLAKSYGSDVEVVECHFDAGGVSYSSSGGHVIISSAFSPDELDKRLIEAIKKTVGLHRAYNFKGVKGLSGRNDLQNVNLAMNGGINYRLIELGMSTNQQDATYMLNNYNEIAKALVEALIGSSKPAPTPATDKLYRVQLGAYTRRENAVIQRDKLIGQGYLDAFIVNPK